MTSNNRFGEEPIPEQERDKIFAAMRYQNDNNICIDCQTKNPRWSSVHLGIHLCIDCAGKHRQYGVVYSFIKSTNLDGWNRKQLLYMQKGSNARALDFFKKCGIISETNKHIDYKSTIAQKYKSILTQEVQAELTGKLSQNKTIKTQTKQQDFFGQNLTITNKQLPQALQKIQISNHTEIVKQEPIEKQKKKKKKAIGKQINLQDFQSMVFDDGVPIQEKQKIIKNNQTEKIENPPNTNPKEPIKIIEEPKQLSEEEAKKKMEQLKGKQNVKSISSEQFKDSNMSNLALKQNLNKFSGSASISSNAFFGQQESSPNHTDKFKEMVTSAGQKIYSKISGYLSKS